MYPRIRLFVLLFATVVTTIVAHISIAEDYFLTIGGGYGTTSNQLSLERNVVFQQSVLSAQRPDRPRHDVFFADGDDESRDVQYRDPEFQQTCPPARRIMAEIFGDVDAVDLVYRNNEVSNRTGAAELSLVKRGMWQIARELKSGDRLIVYVTGHGGAAEELYDDEYDYEYDEDSQSWKANAQEKVVKQEYNRHDTSFYFWDGESVSASEFAKWLDRLPQDAQVVLVMVQCYAGGFAHTIFQQADADLGLSAHARCGFFAQVHDRGAAGCTPDANEADYEEYSSYFWGALGGMSRTGEPITTADYNGDERVSFAEAHAYSVIESDTIDVPVRTSDALLRKFSQLKKVPKKKKAGEGDDNPFGRFLGMLGSDGEKGGPQELMEAKGPLAKLMDDARPDQRAILEKLPAKLGLGANPTVEDVQRELSQVESKLNVANAKLGTATTTQSTTLERVQEEVRAIWPELNAEYSPMAMALTSERADEFVATVDALPSYKALVRSKVRVEQLSEEQMKLAREEARLQRLVNACETIVLAANLPRVAPGEIAARYQQLVAMEEAWLASPTGSDNTSPAELPTTTTAHE